MTVETILRKRRARYKGEIGLFPAAEAFEEDMKISGTLDSDVMCSISSPKNIEQLRFLWALVHRVSDNSNRWLDKDEAMEDLKMRAAFTKVVYDDRKKKLELRPRSLKRATNADLARLTDRVIEIVCSEVLPGMKQNKLKAVIEDMVTRK